MCRDKRQKIDDLEAMQACSHAQIANAFMDTVQKQI
jgi:hypothetical protein